MTALHFTADELAYLESLLRARRDMIADMDEDWLGPEEQAEFDFIQTLHPRFVDEVGTGEEADEESTEEASDVCEGVIVSSVLNVLQSSIDSMLGDVKPGWESEVLAPALREVKIAPQDLDEDGIGFYTFRAPRVAAATLFEFAASTVEDLKGTYGESIPAKDRRRDIEVFTSLRASLTAALAPEEGEV